MRSWLLLCLLLAACGDDTGSAGIDTGADNNLRPARDAGPTADASDVADAADEADLPFDGECRTDVDCDDGVFCNGVERCFEFSCFDSPIPQCGDPSDCTEDVCDEENRRCEYIPDDSLCQPGQVCDSKAGCFAPAQCSTDADCDDGLLCNGTERCSAGECRPGAPVECDDGVGCTSDTCIEGVGECQSVANHNLCLSTELCGLITGCAARSPCDRDDDCDDGLFCNGTETCVNGLCAPGTEPVVVDALGCTIDQCSEAQDMVLNTPDNARCSDGQYCNGAEVCHPVNGCGAGVPPVTADGVGCTVDSCNEALDFIEHVPDDTACDDGLFCNGAEVCHPIDDCSPGEPPRINDGVGCTTDTCSEVMDEVLHVPDNSVCNDGLFCNGAEVCDPIDDCEAGAVPDGDDGVDCTMDLCDESSDSFVHVTNDSVCDDGFSCTGTETCDAVAGCQIGTPPDIDDNVACTVDMCDEQLGSVHTPDDSLCDDGAFCNGVETCDAVLGCQAGTPPPPPPADDGVSCTELQCNDDIDDYEHLPNDTLCDNGDACDGAEVCDLTGGCMAGPPPQLDDGNVCTTDTCSGGNITHTPVTNGTGCGSGLICVSGSCGSSVCGDGYVDGGAGEQCDDGGTANGDGCDSNCQTEGGGTCDPNGTWVPQGEMLSYSCAFTLVSYSISSFEFLSGGATVSPSPSGQTMTGAAVSCPSGNLDVSAFIPGGTGGCDEEYSLDGSWTDANTFEGDFIVRFGTGGETTCFDCVDQFHSVTLIRQ